MSPDPQASSSFDLTSGPFRLAADGSGRLELAGHAVVN